MYIGSSVRARARAGSGILRPCEPALNDAGCRGGVTSPPEDLHLLLQFFYR